MPPGISPDGLPHHWVQGPQDVTQLHAPIEVFEKRFTHQFTWMLDDTRATRSMRPSAREDFRYQVNYTLNLHGLGWHRTGVHFSEVFDRNKAHVLLRIGDDIPPGADPPVWAPGWHYWDGNKAIAQITARADYLGGYSAWSPGFVYILGMELAGHACFRMWDMYTLPHLPYTGAMGGWVEAMKTRGYPTQLEIDSGKAWLQGNAVHVHWE